MDLKDLFNLQNFQKFTNEEKDELFKYLPDCDQDSQNIQNDTFRNDSFYFVRLIIKLVFGAISKLYFKWNI
jgi:hypothetical protein